MSETASRPSSRRYSISHLMLIVPWVALVIDAWSLIRDNSFLWHVRAGELQMEAGRALTRDPFSFTMQGEPWRTQSWLVELLYAGGEQVSQLGFVPPMLLTLSTVTFAAIALISYRHSGSVPTAAVVLLLSTVLLISFLVPRPVLFSFALFALVILAWERPSMRWTLPFLFWLWASAHGSFLIGLGYVGLSLIASREWRWLPTAIVAGLATLATAHGLGVVEMLIDFLEARDTLGLLSEWQRPTPLSAVFAPFLAGLMIIVLGLVRGRIPLRLLWVIVPFAALGFGSTRSVPPAWIGLIPAVSMGLSGLRVGSRRKFSAKAAAVFAVMVVVMPFTVADNAGLATERFPVEAVAALDGSPMFHDDRAGGYLIWAGGPDRLVYIDDRAELYGDRMAEFVAVRDGSEPWEPVFERDRVGQALLRSDSEELVAGLTAAGWRTVHRDESYVVLRP